MFFKTKQKNPPKCRHTPKPQPQDHQDTAVSCISCICLALSPAPSRRQDCERVLETGGAGLCTYAVQGIRLSSSTGPASLPASWPLPLAESSSNINNCYLVLSAVNGDRREAQTSPVGVGTTKNRMALVGFGVRSWCHGKGSRGRKCTLPESPGHHGSSPAAVSFHS